MNNRILIVKLGAIGDVLRTTCILPALHNKYPNSAITWVTKQDALALLDHNSFISRRLAIEGNYLEFILNEKFDIGICLDADKLSAAVLNIAKCDEKYGFITDECGQVLPANELAYEWYIMGIDDRKKRGNRKTYFEHIYKMCNLDGAYFKPQYTLSSEQRLFKEVFFNKNNLSKYESIIGINTGGGSRWQLKRWTNEGYVKLIRLWKQKYPQDAVILYGGPEEKRINKEIRALVGDLIIDAGCHNAIEEFASLLALSDCFITPDSLGMHLSVALNVPTVVLVGPTSPWELDMFGNGGIIYSDLDCIGCYSNRCDKKINCMNSITPELVLREIENIMKGLRKERVRRTIKVAKL